VSSPGKFFLSFFFLIYFLTFLTKNEGVVNATQRDGPHKHILVAVSDRDSEVRSRPVCYF
jgi:hypothetical protein